MKLKGGGWLLGYQDMVVGRALVLDLYAGKGRGTLERVERLWIWRL